MTQKQKQRKKNFAFPQHLFQKVNLKVNWRLVNRSFGAVIVVMVVAYIVSVNDLAIQSFTLSQTKNKISEIQKESERLNLVAMDLGSYESISRRAAAMKMVKVDKIDYIEIKASAVAKK